MSRGLGDVYKRQHIHTHTQKHTTHTHNDKQIYGKLPFFQSKEKPVILNDSIKKGETIDSAAFCELRKRERQRIIFSAWISYSVQTPTLNHTISSVQVDRPLPLQQNLQ